MLDAIDGGLRRADPSGNLHFGQPDGAQMADGFLRCHFAKPIRNRISRQYAIMLACGASFPDHRRMLRLADNLRYLLGEARLSENALAEKTGIPQPTINRILKEQSKDPRDSTLVPIAKYFRVSVEALRRANLRDSQHHVEGARTALDNELLRQAVTEAEQRIAARGLTMTITPEDRAEVVAAVYEGLREGIGIAQVGRFVDGTLRAIARGTKVS